MAFYNRAQYLREQLDSFADHTSGCSGSLNLEGGLGFTKAQICESVGDKRNRMLSHAGAAAGDFTLDPGPSSRGREAVKFGDGVGLRHPGGSCRHQILPADV
jgi:hypothetical protein